MKYQVVDKVLGDTVLSIVVRYYVNDENEQVIFERVENFDFKTQELDMKVIQDTIINRGKEVKLLYEVQQQLAFLEGDISDEVELPLEGEI